MHDHSQIHCQQCGRSCKADDLNRQKRRAECPDCGHPIELFSQSEHLSRQAAIPGAVVIKKGKSRRNGPRARSVLQSIGTYGISEKTIHQLETETRSAAGLKLPAPPPRSDATALRPLDYEEILDRVTRAASRSKSNQRRFGRLAEGLVL